MSPEAKTLELFDSRGRFVMPTPEQVAALDPQTQKNFAAVSDAAQELEQATAARVAAEQAVTDALTERSDAEAELKRVRPKLSAVENAKEFIRSERSQR